ncbi:glycoside hydrolase family 5 protein [Gorillibacterium sp. sgz500922]|uniref:glycoside hydrolase family 5 protein n=1 Tax=Gorillibacterium sp. sgz500922 TaxID=3446694 RepID=UPI003F673903
MFEQTARSRVNGFLRAEGRTVVNGNGEEIILTGWGLGNWLLPEGYMWLTHHGRFDRPHRIEAVIRELAGADYAERFWTSFRERYITREDIRLMAELGYNSVRIPFGWRVLMEEGPGLHWKEEGFALLDRCLDWCEEFGLYAFLDLHGAPGGQTGANIDDCVDDVPRLYTDEDSWTKAIGLWKELARRYRDRWIVGGYDLLNEPVRPGLMPDYHPHYYVQRLVEFYEEVIPAIRAIDSRHMLSVEGHHWATDPAIFFKRYDDNMVVHFHRYACMPGIEAYRTYLEVSERLNQPLWLGETGENRTEWFAAMYPLAVSLGIGFNLWPWKKMQCDNSPLSILKPDGWDELLAYAAGGPHPGFERARKSLDSFLDLLAAERCTTNPAVTAAVFRRPGCRVRGTDFDQLPGKGVSFSGRRPEGNLYGFRCDTGMGIVPLSAEPWRKEFFFDSGWDRLVLELTEGEFAAYTFTSVGEGSSLTVDLECPAGAALTLHQEERELLRTSLPVGEAPIVSVKAELVAAAETVIRLSVRSGRIRLHAISLH